MEKEFSATKGAFMAAVSLATVNFNAIISGVAGVISICYLARKWWAFERWLKKKKSEGEVTQFFKKDED